MIYITQLIFKSEADLAAFLQDERRLQIILLKEAFIKSSILVKGTKM